MVALPPTSPHTRKVITAMPGEEYGGIRPVALKVVVEVHALDDDANTVLDLGSDELQGLVSKAVDQALADHIAGQWACAVHVSRVVG